MIDRRFLCGLIVGGIAVAASWFLIDQLFSRTDDQSSDVSARNSPNKPEQTSITNAAPLNRRWVQEAKALTMPGNREYTMPLNNPDTVPAFAADHMNDGDLVVGINVFGFTRAYPWWIMSNFHVVNDTLYDGENTKIPLLVALCEQCSGSAAFIPTILELQDRPLTFQICGIHNGTFEIADFQTHSRWHPFSGESIEGPLKGKQLIQIGSVIENWGSWKKRHPETDVVLGSIGMRNRPHGLSHGASMGHKHMHPVFWASANQNDRRLSANTLIFGLLGNGVSGPMAIEFEEIQSNLFLQFKHGNTPAVLLQVGEYGVRAFSSKVEEKELEFELESKDPLSLKDNQGRVWDESGKCITPPDSTLQLKLLKGYLTEWYEWVSAQPDSAILGKP
ncbi:MAG: DUF3179 domain-containing protein [Verrucomicrobia bacterium]|jgi:hypothetical protein|nr:DUF3179 domain-containing protein [Verrucomicrobiota bacterium]